LELSRSLKRKIRHLKAYVEKSKPIRKYRVQETIFLTGLGLYI
jgi:hypothetical protein